MSLQKLVTSIHPLGVFIVLDKICKQVNSYCNQRILDRHSTSFLGFS